MAAAFALDGDDVIDELRWDDIGQQHFEPGAVALGDQQFAVTHPVADHFRPVEGEAFDGDHLCRGVEIGEGDGGILRGGVSGEKSAERGREGQRRDLECVHAVAAGQFHIGQGVGDDGSESVIACPPICQRGDGWVGDHIGVKTGPIASEEDIIARFAEDGGVEPCAQPVIAVTAEALAGFFDIDRVVACIAKDR